MKRTIILSKIAVYFAVILWIFSVCNFFTKNKTDSRENIVQAFTNAALLDTSAKVNCVSEYNGVFKTLSEQEEMLKAAASTLGLSGYQVMSGNDGETIKTTLTLSRDRLSVILTFSSVGEKQYISMEVNLPSAVETAFDYKKKMETAVKNMGIKTTVRMYFQGSIRGDLKLETRDDVADGLLADMDARVVSENRDMECYNIYAYAKDIGEAIWVDGQKVNINLSMNYNEINDRTYIYLALPMNNQDF
ncbi:MAG: YwmB family TATA-box binding protein [Lachnospiraceae bacterium]